MNQCILTRFCEHLNKEVHQCQFVKLLANKSLPANGFLAVTIFIVDIDICACLVNVVDV